MKRAAVAVKLHAQIARVGYPAHLVAGIQNHHLRNQADQHRAFRHAFSSALFLFPCDDSTSLRLFLSSPFLSPHFHAAHLLVPTDTSKNNWMLALVTLGEGWHNNHHHYMASARQGFYWWEVDITFYALKVLSWFRIVRELRKVPEHVLAEGQALAAAA